MRNNNRRRVDGKIEDLFEHEFAPDDEGHKQALQSFKALQKKEVEAGGVQDILSGKQKLK